MSGEAEHVGRSMHGRRKLLNLFVGLISTLISSPLWTLVTSRLAGPQQWLKRFPRQ